MHQVVPLVGTWIEIKKESGTMKALEVVPLVGTWIEINKSDYRWQGYECRSSRRNVD